MYKDQYDKHYNSWVKAYFAGNIKETPISMGGVASGKTPFVTVIINDKVLLQKAKELEITLNNGDIVKEKINGKGTIILFQNEQNTKPISYTKVIVYDTNMEKLYEK